MYVKIAFLDASVIILNSQAANSDFKMNLRKLPPRQYFPIENGFFFRSPESKKSPEQNPAFSTCSNTFCEQACVSLSIKYNMRMWHGSQVCREKLHFQQIKLCSCVVILQNNPGNLYLDSVYSEGVW